VVEVRTQAMGFRQGTPIHTQQGLKPVETLAVGDWVLARPGDAAPPPRRRTAPEYTYRRVTRVASATLPLLVQITYVNAADKIRETVELAADHAVWLKDQGWVAACDIKPLDAVVLSFNGHALVAEVQVHNEPAHVHVLELEAFDTCHAGRLGAWVSTCRAGSPRTAPAATTQPLDLRKSATLLEMKDFYNDTLAEPFQPEPLAAEYAAGLRDQAEQIRTLVSQNFALDYDEEGVRWLDRYLERQHQEHKQSEMQPGLIQALGSFLGECILRKFGGQWGMANGQACVMLPGFAVFPHNKVQKHLANGAAGGDSVLALYTTQAALASVFGSAERPLSPRQKRLLEFHRRGERVFVLHTSDGKAQWAPVTHADERSVGIDIWDLKHGKVSIPLTQVESFYVCAADGRLVQTEWVPRKLFDSLPADIHRAVEASLPKDNTLSLADVAAGSRFVTVQHGESSNKKAGDASYATSLTNVSSKKLRITRFGGFVPDGTGKWQLSSVTGTFYTADDFVDWYGQNGDWLLPGQTVRDDSNWGAPPVLWAYYGVTDTGEPFIAGEAIDLPASGRHHVAPRPADPPMEQAMQKLRTAYAQRQARFTDVTLSLIRVAAPPWLKQRPTDRMNEIVERQSLLYAEGTIVWAALVQANKLMFVPGDADCPGLLVYSPDPYFDARPAELRDVAQRMFGYKGTEPGHEELKRLAELVSDEAGRSLKFALPKVLSSRDIDTSTFMIFRRHIPNGVLTMSMFPILIHPATPVAMMVPFESWPGEMIALWREGRL
jgi:hypothetical protein